MNIAINTKGDLDVKVLKEFWKDFVRGDTRASMLISVCCFLVVAVSACLSGKLLVMQVFFYYVAIILMMLVIHILINKFL